MQSENRQGNRAYKNLYFYFHLYPRDVRFLQILREGGVRMGYRY